VCRIDRPADIDPVNLLSDDRSLAKGMGGVPLVTGR
jgi:hypothetical protein